MSDAVLTKVQGIALLRELATNEAFRKHFEEKPAAALVELGIPYHTVVNLPAACHAPRKVAGEKEMLAALEALERDISNACLTMNPPKAAL
jgi:putative modified peptide